MNVAPMNPDAQPHTVGDFYLNQQIGDIKASLSGMRGENTSEFREIRNMVGDMVSQKEFEATIKRVDQKHESQDAIIESNKKHADENHDNVMKALGEIKSGARWWVGIGVTLLAIAIPLITNLVGTFFNR